MDDKEETIMNYMEQVAHMLGVELGERFKVSGMDGRFWIDEIGLCMEDDKGDYDLNAVMMALLTGRSKIERLPWVPKCNEYYWFVDPYGEVLEDAFIDDDIGSLLTVKSGRIYRTEEEAKAHKEEDKAFWDEIRKELEG